MIDFYLKKGDTLPVFRAELLDADDNPVNINNSLITLHYTLRYPGSTVNTRSMDIVNPVSGLVQYTFTTGDTLTPGLYTAEIVATFTGTSQEMTFPPGSNLLLQVTEDIS